jgi:hypothetical protein
MKLHVAEAAAFSIVEQADYYTLQFGPALSECEAIRRRA